MKTAKSRHGPGPVIQALVTLVMALLAASCSSSSSGNTNYSQFYELLRQSLSASFGNIRVTRDQAASVSYASMGYRLDGGNQAMLILATDSGGELLWTSGAHVVIVTRGGRIVRTLGLDHDLSGLTTPNNAPPVPLLSAVRAPFTSTRLVDFPELGGPMIATSRRPVAAYGGAATGATVWHSLMFPAQPSREISRLAPFRRIKLAAVAWRSAISEPSTR